MLCAGEVVTSLVVLPAYFHKSEPVLVAGRSFHALSYRLSGKVRITVSDKSLFSEAGCLTFTPQGTSYETEVLEDGEIVVIHFTTTGGSEDLMPAVFVPEHADAMHGHFMALLERYKVEAPEGTPGWELLEMAGRKRGFLLARGEINTERMAKVLIDEFRSGKLGKFTLEMPEEMV